MKKLAIFASGSGTNFEAITKATFNGSLKLDVAILITDKDCFALKRAEKLGIKSQYINPKDFKGKEEYEKRIVEVLHENKVEVIALAGYMRIIGNTLLEAYQGRIINIHPSLLPAFMGSKDAMKDAYEYGVKVYGITVHLVDEVVDGGKIIDQEALHVTNETFEEIQEALHNIEHTLYPRVLKMWEE